ncbi:HlyD family type I secretion periplasmic adaptor subunit [Marinivivus vitaminiproducens]|uniref:HlyD family type I secretion periplasmic adaptor subunit n=1 Tax=Marinivivus vitaminiproducens TaxID=3035935 RepID=UPI00279FF1A5|nr:HlyD family type I secretion periplasmic adaptor subunit [Geminicoccaceae bacterium SCSIO 64248]
MATAAVQGGMASPRREDRDFLRAVQAAALHRPRPFASLLLATILLFFVVFVAWAAVARLDEVTRGDGRVVPSRQVQVVQNQEGGIVTELAVREGDMVEAGQVLLRLDNVTASSGYREDRARALAIEASLARLEAEIGGGEPVFPDAVSEGDPRAAANELALFRTRRDGLAAELAILEDQRLQRRQQIDELRSQERQLERSLGLAQEELRITRPLVERQIVARVDLLRLQRQVADLEGGLEQARLAIPRAESALSEAVRRIDERTLAFRAEAQRERNTLAAELAALREALDAGQDRVRRSDVRSPVRGTVKQVMIHTVGGVIQPGMNLIEIVPADDNLLVEARVRPGDIAFLRPGLPAMVKVTAYDFAIYGGLRGQVETISADTIEDEQGERFFKVLVRTDGSQLENADGPLPTIPGMTVQVDVLTGDKTVLDYLLKPILRARDHALRER